MFQGDRTVGIEQNKWSFQRTEALPCANTKPVAGIEGRSFRFNGAIVDHDGSEFEWLVRSRSMIVLSSSNSHACVSLAQTNMHIVIIVTL